MAQIKNETNHENFIELVDSNEFHKDNSSEAKFQIKQIKQKLFVFMRTRYFYYLLLWIILMIISTKLQIAKIFICFSGILLIFCNLGKRAPGTLSAYSIFNKNHEKLLGTFDAQEVDKQFANRLNDDRSDIIHKKHNENDDDYEVLLKIKESYEKNQSKFANQPCYCGSQIKYKKCCYWRELKKKEEIELERKKK